MAYSFDIETKKIVIPRGDTATLNLTVSGGGTQDGDEVVFRVRDMARGTWVITKRASVASGSAEVRITSADTRTLSATGRYGWTIGVVTGADNDADGHPAANDDNDTVLTAYNKFMEFAVPESGVLGKD